MNTTTTCPRCGGATITKRDGIFQWRVCRKPKSCGWTVFNHGDDARDNPPPPPAPKLWDLPIFGWAWREDGRDLRA